MTEKNQAFVKNAADKEQVKEGSRKERDKRKQELLDLQVVLDLPAGRRLLWRFLTECKTFESIWESSARIHYLAGKQDLGHFIMAEIVAADEDSLLTMMKEAKSESV
jgi:hypothetical protein